MLRHREIAVQHVDRHRCVVADPEGDIGVVVGKRIRSEEEVIGHVSEASVRLEIDRPVCWAGNHLRGEGITVRIEVVGHHAVRPHRQGGVLDSGIDVVDRDRRAVQRHHVDEERVGDRKLVKTGPGGAGVRCGDPDALLACAIEPKRSHEFAGTGDGVERKGHPDRGQA